MTIAARRARPAKNDKDNACTSAPRVNRRLQPRHYLARARTESKNLKDKPADRGGKRKALSSCLCMFTPPGRAGLGISMSKPILATRTWMPVQHCLARGPATVACRKMWFGIALDIPCIYYHVYTWTSAQWRWYTYTWIYMVCTFVNIPCIYMYILGISGPLGIPRIYMVYSCMYNRYLSGPDIIIHKIGIPDVPWRRPLANCRFFPEIFIFSEHFLGKSVKKYDITSFASLTLQDLKTRPLQVELHRTLTIESGTAGTGLQKQKYQSRA